MIFHTGKHEWFHVLLALHGTCVLTELWGIALIDWSGLILLNLLLSLIPFVSCYGFNSFTFFNGFISFDGFDSVN